MTQKELSANQEKDEVRHDMTCFLSDPIKFSYKMTLLNAPSFVKNTPLIIEPC